MIECIQEHQITSNTTLMKSRQLKMFQGIKEMSIFLKSNVTQYYINIDTPHNRIDPMVPCRDPSGSERLEGVSVAQQLLLLHLTQDVLAEHTGEAELAVAHQREHQVHQLFQNVLRQLHQTEGQRKTRWKSLELHMVLWKEGHIFWF